MECNYNLCEAKIHLNNLRKRLDDGNTEFQELRSESRDLNRRITEIATHQTKISADLLIHMNRSEDKHQQLVELITVLGTKLAKHTEDEMKLQTEVTEKLDELNNRMFRDETKVKLLWTGAGLLIVTVLSFAWEHIKKALGL